MRRWPASAIVAFFPTWLGRTSLVVTALLVVPSLPLSGRRRFYGSSSRASGCPSTNGVDRGFRSLGLTPVDSHVVVNDAVARIRQDTDLEPLVGVVLGSGLGGLADQLEGPVEIPYGEIPGWPASTAVGHAGVLVLGTIDGVPVAVLKGRAHLYEGIGADRAVFGVRVLGRLGVRTLVVTNAAGAIDESLRPGQLVLISDHVNLLGTSPLVGPNDDTLGPRFPDLSDAYDPVLRARAHEAAAALGLELAEGVYGAWLGPQFETPAEIRFLRVIGCDLAGMSTVPEVIAARHLGIRCLGISVVTNLAAGVVEGKLDHEGVLAVGAEAQPRLTALLRALLPALAA